MSIPYWEQMEHEDGEASRRELEDFYGDADDEVMDYTCLTCGYQWSSRTIYTCNACGERAHIMEERP